MMAHSHTVVIPLFVGDAVHMPQMGHGVGQQGVSCKRVRSGSVQLHAMLSSCSLPRGE